MTKQRRKQARRRQEARIEREKMLPLNRRPGWIYFIRQRGTGLVKVGITVAEPKTRLDILQIGNPFKLDLENTRRHKHGLRDHERGLHYALKDQRVRGEWFRMTEQEVTWYAEGKFVVDVQV